MTDRTKLVAPCGIDCGICELYESRNNSKLMDYLISKGIPQNVLPCDGCRNIEGKCPVIQGDCATFECVKEKGISFCYECSDFPCTKLAPSADRANILPHNMKVYNLCSIRRDGVEKFAEKSSEIKKTYYEGKMEIGNGPKS
ncbi:MAG: DUF3795 domain-containing protein [Spirochaetes bacterium]|nr:DUF3795 domain-containing protein [Spirochaetota bacterium]